MIPSNPPTNSSDDILQPALFSSEDVPSYQTEMAAPAFPDPSWSQSSPSASADSTPSHPNLAVTITPVPVGESLPVSGDFEPDPTQPLTKEDLAYLQASLNLEALRGWYKCAVLLSKPANYLSRIVEVKDAFLKGTPPSAKALSAMQGDVLDALRLWYKSAQDLQKQPAYLERIMQLAEEFKAGTFLSEQALTYMQQDIHRYRNLSNQRQST
jgi:hypothetical protein